MTLGDYGTKHLGITVRFCFYFYQNPYPWVECYQFNNFEGPAICKWKIKGKK
jgi:hypothetical protein